MKKTSTTISLFKTMGLLCLSLFAASCANDLKFVKVKGNESNTVAQRTEPKTETRAYAIQKAADSQPAKAETVAVAKPEGSEVVAENLTAEQHTNVSTKQVVREEMKKNATFNGLSTAQQEKVENAIAKRIDRVVAKKKASPAPAPSVEFTRIMLIGLIVLLAGILLGAIVGGLGWLAFVVGLGLIVYGLIIQL